MKLALLWHDAGSPNLGVRALTTSHLALIADALPSLERRHVLFLGTHSSAAGAEYVPAQGLWRALAKRGRTSADLAGCDVALDIGEGDSFAGIYGRQRFERQVLSKAACLRAGTPLILAPQTIGPFIGRAQREIARFVLERSTAVFVRDLESHGAVSTLAPEANLLLASDLAFALPSDGESPQPSSTRLQIGLNVSGLLHTNSSDGSALGRMADYHQLVRSLLSHFAKQKDTQLHIIPHVLENGTPDEDVEVSRQIKAEWPEVVLAPTFGSAEAAKAYIAGMDVFIGSRMHATIAAVSSGVATIPLAYSRKFNGLFRSLGYDFYVDLQALDAEAAFSETVRLLEQHELLASAAVSATNVARRRLEVYRQYLKLTLPKIGGGVAA